MQYFIKVLISAILIVLISESAKKWTLLGALIASLPLTSVLAMVWLYLDTNDLQQVSKLSLGIFWIVIPSLVFFVTFPNLVKIGWSFWPSLFCSILITGGAYWGYVQALHKLGIEV